MRYTKTQVFILNHEKRIRLLANLNDEEFLRLALKLPDCRWNEKISSLHTAYVESHISFFNSVFPPGNLFIDISHSSKPLILEENSPAKDIIIIRPMVHSGNVILEFKHDDKIESIIRSSGFVKSDANQLAWKGPESLVQDVQFNLALLKSGYQRKTIYTNSYPVPVEHGNNKIGHCLQEFELALRNKSYSQSTIKQYIFSLRKFLQTTGIIDITDHSALCEQIETLTLSGKLTSALQNQMINSIKAYLRLVKVYPQEWTFPIFRHRRKVRNNLNFIHPDPALTESGITNLKHRAIIKLINENGLTVSEICRLQNSDIDLDKALIHLYKPSSEASRILSISEELKDQLHYYLEVYKPRKYLFEGKQGKSCSHRFIQKVTKKYYYSQDKSIVSTPNLLRKMYAINLVKKGISPQTIQKLLGHKTPKAALDLYKQFRNQPANTTPKTI